MAKIERCFQMDVIDRRILIELQRDGSLSNAVLAELVGSSPPSCWRRVKALEAAGVLGKTVRLVDPKKIGLGMDMFCQVRMRHHDQDSRRDFENFVAEQDHVVACSAITGEWDYMLHVVVGDVAEYHDFLMNKVLVHPSVDTSSSGFALQRVKSTTALPIK